MKTIVVLGMLATRAAEIAYLQERIDSYGCKSLVIDISLRNVQDDEADANKEGLIQHVGDDPSVWGPKTRAEAIQVMIDDGRARIKELYRVGLIDGIIGMGSGTETTIATGIMRALDFGFPKVMISTVASGDTRSFVGIKDITMIHSVVEILGLNMLTRRIIANGAAAVYSMTQVEQEKDPKHNGIIAISMFGVTTTGVLYAKELLERANYEVIIFPTVGSGGIAMETLINEGMIDGVLDMTITELADELVGGIMSAGPERLEAAGEKAIPQVIGPGALDMVNFGNPETISESFRGRRFYPYSPDATLMRTSPEENEKLGRLIAEKLNKAKGPSVVVIPSKGFSPFSVKHHPFYNPVANQAFINALQTNLKKEIPLIIIDEDINSKVYVETVVDKLLELMKKAKKQQATL